MTKRIIVTVEFANELLPFAWASTARAIAAAIFGCAVGVTMDGVLVEHNDTFAKVVALEREQLNPPS